MKYSDFLSKKQITIDPCGFDSDHLSDRLYDYQRDLVRWALKRGRAALFTMTGTGKTPMQVCWADAVHRKTEKPVLILAPLAVAKQTARMAESFSVDVRFVRDESQMTGGVSITNYDMLHHFSPRGLGGIVLDESSILKSFSGKMRNSIIEFSRNVTYKLACTATPAPNDFMEIGNHAEFLGVMSYNEMLATFFVHDGGDTSKWRLKGHAEERFWEWVAQWGAFLEKPSDLGYSDEGFGLPALHTIEHVVPSVPVSGQLFASLAGTLQERREARRLSMADRIHMVADIVKRSDSPFLVWCDLNAESRGIVDAIPGCVEITGSDPQEKKERNMLDFAEGKIDCMVTKPDIAGFGMNWQVCSNTAFLGLSDSFEMMFQATKRFHRHGQKNTVTRHIIISESEGSVLQNIKRKEEDFMRMIGEMVQHTKKINIENVHNLRRESISYDAESSMVIPAWLHEETVHGH